MSLTENIRDFYYQLTGQSYDPLLQVSQEDSLKIVCETGEVFTIQSDNWSYDPNSERIFFITWKNDDLPSEKQLTVEKGLSKLHLPVKTLTAAHNRDIEEPLNVSRTRESIYDRLRLAEKSESLAFKPVEITRYSKIGNVSSLVSSQNPFSPPVIEVWF